VTTPRLAGDGGSALVEFCFLSVLMLVPLVYLVVALGRVQAGAFAAEAAAREAGRAFVTADDEVSGRSRAESAAEVAFADQGFDAPGEGVVELGCERQPCLQPDARVDVRTRVRVALPLAPRFLDGIVPTLVVVDARHVASVDRFRAVLSPVDAWAEP
jgi:Flp pilus assembly protein TadG